MEWITKKLVASLVNKWLGHIIEEINSQEINDALLGGELNLTNLKVRKDALSFLNGIYENYLPIEVLQGIIGRISLTVPYSNIFTQPLILTIQDVLLLVTPALEYDPDEQRERERNFKNSLLQQLFQEKIAVDAEGGQAGLLGLLYNRIWNNLQLKINDVHIRYEDTHSCPSPLVIGFCLQSLSAETTNHKWKKVPLESSSQSVSKVVEVVSAAVYVNPEADNQRLVKQHILTDRWTEFLSQGLRSFSINEERFKFVVTPLRCKVKIRQHITKEARVPGLLVDAMIRENVNVTFQQQQYMALLQLAASFATINLNKKFIKYKPAVPLKRHSSEWWLYAYNSVVKEYIRTFSWCHIKNYRMIYKEYVQMFKRYLVEKRDRELEADMLKLEDKLNLETIVAGRMEAKILLSKEEPDLLKPVVKASCGWFSWLFGGSNKDVSEEDADEFDVVASRRTNQILASMSYDERLVLRNELSSLNKRVEERHKEDIDQKIYFSLKELTVTLKDEEHKDVGLCIITGFVLSFENRLGVRYKKVSVKLESLSIEAANLEDDLVHILKLVEGSSTTVGYGVTFACDFETRPLSGNEDYGLTIKLDPVEVSYHQEALMRLIYFFNVNEFQLLRNKIQGAFNRFSCFGKSTINSAVKRKTLLALDLDLKSPYIILPEYGSIQSGGNVLIIDLGGLKIFTELGGYVKNVEEATRMELEEKLYDRITIIVSHFQILFADSGDEWRVMRTRDESDLHLLPRVRMKFNFANNVYPELREHPKQKIDVHFTPIKLNLSDNKINHLIEFVQKFPTLEKVFYESSYSDQSLLTQDSNQKLKDSTLVELFHTLGYLYLKLKPKWTKPGYFKTASTPELLRHVKPLTSFDTISQTSLELAKYFPEESDEEDTNFSKPVDLLGFEDNTSPTNMISILSRFCIDEIIISISRSCDSGERPYLMIKAARFLVESAIMDYGPALQITVGSLHLVDKYHHNPTGEYLELVSSSSKGSLLTILYRKVRADCPDFKSNFHSCEQSLVVDISSINLVWHRSALLSLTNFITHLPSKLCVLYSFTSYLLDKHFQQLKLFYWSSNEDPPVPSGATKWSTNVSVNQIALKFCDNEVDFLYLKLSGFLCGCVFKANEKIIFKTSLADILLEDLSDISLYSRVVEVEEDLVFDVKIVKFSRFLCDLNEPSNGDNMCKPDVSVSIQVGRLQCVLLYKLLSDFARFSDSFPAKEYCQNNCSGLIRQVKNCVTEIATRCKVTLSFCIRTPNLLIPQKSDSPCLLVFNLGDFKVDNFFKPVPGSASSIGVLENILLEIGPIEICRAVMTLGGGLELQEAILEPIKIKIDLKRSLMRQCRDVLSWDVAMNVDAIYINLGQRDLNTILGVMTQNKAEAHFPDRPSYSRPLTPVSGISSVAQDDNVGKLHAFLNRSVDIYRIAFASVLLESMRITLYTDMNEVLSSPVRDAATALCKFEVGEIEIRGDMNNDQSVELSATLKSCDVYDVRADSCNFVKKIFGHLVNEVPIIHGGFKFNLPPLLDIAIKISPNGDSNTEINIDKIRLNMSVNLALAIYNYVSNAVPVSANSSCGILNPGFVEDVGPFAKNDFVPPCKAQSSSDSTSGYLSTDTCCSENERVVSISLKTKLPEIVLFVDPEETDSRVIVFRCHFQCDYSKHPFSESFKVNLDKAVTFTSLYSTNDQHPYMVMLPCYLEGAWNMKGQDDEKVSIKASVMSFYICPAVAQMMNCLAEELAEFLSTPDPIQLQLPIAESEDLWSPKPLNATLFPSDPKDEIYVGKKLPLRKKKQQLKFEIPSLKIYLENCFSNTRVPVFAFTTAIEAEVNSWSRALHGNAKFHLSSLCFNDEHSAWEYIIEPLTEGGKMRPLEIEMRFVQHLAQSIGTKRDVRNKSDDSFDTWSRSDRCSHKDTFANESKSSSEEEDNGNNEMVILKPNSSRMKRSSIRRNIADIPTISGYSMDSDSETEGSLLYKMTSTFSHMFSSDSELSDDDLHTEVEEGSVEEETNNKKASGVNFDNATETTGLKHNHVESVLASEGEADNFPVFVEDSENIYNSSMRMESTHSNVGTTFLVCLKDPIEFSITPKMVNAAHTLYNDYINPKSDSHLPNSVKRARDVQLTNEIGPNTKVSIISYEEFNDRVERKIVAESKFKEMSSLPSSPGSSRSSSRKNSVSVEEASSRVIDWDNLELNAPSVTEEDHPLPKMEHYSQLGVPDAVQLYQSIIKQRIRVEVPGFDALEVFAGTRSQNRLFQLSPLTAECKYHIMVMVEISHLTTSVTVRSPLQILNDLSLPINICFKKSALQNILNDKDASTRSPTHSLASLGSASNPFEEYPSLVTLQPDETYALPLSVAYHSPIFIAPSATDYHVSKSGIWWKEMQSSTGARIISCLPKSGEGCPISVACSLTEGVRIQSSIPNEAAFVNVPNYILKLSSPINVYNYLPYTLVLQNRKIPTTITLDPGGCTSIIRMDPHSEEELDVHICNYQGSDWRSVLCIPVERNEASRTLAFSRTDGTSKRKIEVSLYTSRDVTTSVYVYAPYWIVNKTRLPLQVRGTRSKFVSESFGSEEILLFRYKKNHPHKMKIKVLESDWSRGWCCDAVGTCGVVICEDKLRNKKFRILSKISQSTLKAFLPVDGRKGPLKPMFQLTKIVTLMPYFLVRNTTYKPLMYMQESDKNGLWFDIGPNQCESFWPNSDDMYLVVRRQDTQVISQRFHFNSIHKTVLRMEKGRAMVVTVDGVGSDEPVTISFSKYKGGDAPIRLENWCDDVFLRFHQRGSNQVTLLAPRQSILYTWDDPTLRRDLLWNIYSKKSEDFTAVINLDKHGTERVTVTSLKQGSVRAQSQSSCGTPKVRPKRSTPRQRARTTPSTSSTEEEEELPDGWLLVGKDKEKKGQSGLSPSNGCHRTHLRGTQRDKMIVHWVCHQQGNQRVLLFTQADRLAYLTRLPKESAKLEFILSMNRLGISIINSNNKEILYGGIFPSTPLWQLEVDGVWKVPPSMELCSWLEDQYLCNAEAQVSLKGSMQVDLRRMRMLAPFSGRLRRIKKPALWIHYRHSSHYAYCRAKINSLQIDNQTEEAVYSNVLTSHLDKIPDKPCVDFCIVTHSGEQDVQTIRHLSLVCQEFSLNLDRGLFMAVQDFINPYSYILTRNNIHSELKTLLTPLTFTSYQRANKFNDCSSRLERFCFAGLQLSVSLTPKGISPSEKIPDLLVGALASLGISLGEVKNVLIKVSQLESEATTFDQAMKDLKNHIKHQVLQQLYVLILGLDILGNPYQRLKDLVQGVQDLVFDATTGTMERPDDYADEISDEVFSLCGHVIGDDTHNFQLLNSHQEVDIRNYIIRENKMKSKSSLDYSKDSPNDACQKVTAGAAIPVRCLTGVGLAWALTGMIIDPVSASLQESIECFLRGRARGLVGLVSNSSFGVNNPVAMAIDGLRRAQILGYEAYFRLRAQRHSSQFSPLKSVNQHESEGLALMMLMPQRFLSNSDKYFGHVYLSDSKHPPIFLATIRNFYYIEPYGNWGRCEIVWKMSVRNLAKQPTLNDGAITFQLRQDDAQSHLSGAVRLIQSTDTKVLEQIMQMVTSLMTLQMEYLPCPMTS